MIKHIIFDFDGTIADSKDSAVKLLNELAEKHKYQKINKEKLEYLRTLSFVDRCKAINLPLYKIPMLKLELTKDYRKIINNFGLIEGIGNIIVQLKEADYGISIISSNSVDNINLFLNNHNIKMFDNIFSSNNLFGKDKTLSNFLNKYALKKNEVIYIGDEYRDVVACKKTGIKIIAVAWGYDSRELLLKAVPDFFAQKPLDIIGIIESLKNK
ncbi:phosphoglycolate phosphatase [Desulfocucumis palustris]|uniref:Phosphoglycolate phosphatase n=1 Tax=Desulfocucumis palustris TaxID=1898651 RepID=A0A2L2XF26_9FIRM|nr:HAD-IA family hydrolase [Desulfocucumis palustris]GBF34835.1 phosphoglycolate phosphatase [Desulfocucumis palustris]